MVHTIRDMDDECFVMNATVLFASSIAVGIANEPPGWKSFWTSISNNVVDIA